MHLSLGRGMHTDEGEPCKQLSPPNIQMPLMSGSQFAAAAAIGTGKGKEGREADENCWER